jgi:hypothetical protein
MSLGCIKTKAIGIKNSENGGNMTSTEIETKRVEKLKEINSKRDQINTVSERIHELERELLELKEAKRKGRYELSILANDEEILRSEYWSSKQ